MSEHHTSDILSINKLFSNSNEHEEFIKQLENYDSHQIPPDINVAISHYQASRIGKPAYHKKSNKVSGMVVCPCCCGVKKEPYSLLDPPRDIVNFGSTIPLYLQFSKFTVFIVACLLIAAAVNQFIIIESNCEKGICGPNLTTILYTRYEQTEQVWFNFAQYIDTFIFFLMIAGSIVFYIIQGKFASVIEKDVISASDFTVMITNVHQDDSDDSIKNFIHYALMAKRLDDVEILKINKATFAGNLARIKIEIANSDEYIKKLKILLKKDDIPDRFRGPLNKKLTALYKIKDGWVKKEAHYKSKLTNDHSFFKHCIAFVTFSSIEEKDRVMKLAHKPDSLLKMILRLPISLLTICCKRDRKPFHIYEAPEPDDVKWKFIGFSKGERFKTYMISELVTAAVILISFSLQLGIKLYQKHILQNNSNNTPIQAKSWTSNAKIQALQIGSSLAITVINVLLGKITLVLSRYEKHYSESHFNESHAKKLVMAQFFNTGVVPFLLFIIPSEFGGIESLSVYIFHSLFWSSIIGPVLGIIDFNFIFFKVFQRFLLRRKLTNGTFVPMSQEELNKIFEGPDCAICYRYARAITMVLVVSFYHYILPIGPFIVLAALFIYYWVDKYLFLARFKEPQRLRKELAFELSEYLELALVFFTLGNIFFTYLIYKRWKFMNLICFGIAALIYIFPLRAIVNFFVGKEKPLAPTLSNTAAMYDLGLSRLTTGLMKEMPESKYQDYHLYFEVE